MPATEPTTTNPRRTRRRAGRRLLFGLLWAAIGAMAAWNGLYYWNHRPLPDLKTVNRLILRHQDREAESILKARLRQFPHEVASRILLARLLGARGAVAEAAKQLHAVPFWWPEKTDCLLREAQAWISIDHARDAEAAWLAYLRDDPNHPAAKPDIAAAEADLINLYGTEDRWPEVREVVWRSHDRVTTAAGKRELTLMALRTRIERFAPEDSLPKLRRYVAADPGDRHAWIGLARVAEEGKKPAEADKALAHCLATWPDDPDVRRTQLQILALRGESPALDALLANPPESYKSADLYWNLLGLRAFKAGRWQEAADAYRKALRITPSEPESVYRLALSEQRLGHKEQARILLKQHAAMESASSELTRSVNLYLDATMSDPPPGTPSPAEAARKLAEICRTLQWDREAAAWRAVAAQSRENPEEAERGTG